jgi:hypothetical protein
LERQQENWYIEKQEMLSEISSLKQDLSRHLIAVTEMETLRDKNAAIEASNELLKKTYEDYIEKTKEHLNSDSHKVPFPTCSFFDKDHLLQKKTECNSIGNLKDFAQAVRNRMAYNLDTEEPLYYSDEDVRSFIAGLAMSRLHILQGISGTGKTSLPRAFARAVGAGHALIEVQSGWRDRQDLIGYYNSFEKKFYESEFLKSLYKAGSPRYQDSPFIVVLDEMNLSHPEHYFADLLSALEQDSNEQRLVLLNAPVENYPGLFADGGQYFPIPRNIWFVGTANHDETTKDFADKTYDRSYILELPRHHTPFEDKDLQLEVPISMESLEGAFNNAMGKHSREADWAYGFLNKNFAEILGSRFRVGWGNRLENQMKKYVPVLIACGGTIGEATDHILATKILRKIRDRHDNQPEVLLELRDQMLSTWSALDTKYDKPSKSLDVLKSELNRLGYSED